MPDTYIKNGGNWSKFKKAFIKNGGTWSEIKTIWIKNGGVWSKSFVNETIVNVASQNNINLRTLYTNQTGDSSNSAVRVIYNINGNIGSTSTAASLVTGSWPAESVIIINIANGVYVVGKGGNATTYNAPGTEYHYGQAGGDAISLSYDVTIVNNGVIGGGGGGGGGWSLMNGCHAYGGGGAGIVGGNRGAGVAVGSTTTGSTAVTGFFCQAYFDFNGSGGRGGNLGEIGGSMSGSFFSTPPDTRGAAGRAIVRNGFTATRSGSGQTIGAVV